MSLAGLTYGFRLGINCSLSCLLFLMCVNQVYLLDSTVSRAWVDHEGCKEFVSNVLTAFPDLVLVSELV
jgi:hypothetical protein